MSGYIDSQGHPVSINVFGQNSQKILDSSLSTIALQTEIIQDLLKAVQRLTEGLTAANDEIKGLKRKSEELLGTLERER